MMSRSLTLAFTMMAAPIVARAAASSIDGVYSGPAMGVGGGACVNFKMYLRVKDGEASVKHSESVTFEGTVKPDGTIDIPLRNRTFSGQIANGVFKGQVDEACRYILELSKTS